MNRNLGTGFTAGVIGAVVLTVIMYVMFFATAQPPMFVNSSRALLGENPMLNHIVGAIGFLLAGGIWGLIFAAVVSSPTVLKGILFGIAPTLFLWLVVMPLSGMPMFGGFAPQALIMPLIFNCLVWGGIVGWYCSRRN